MRGITRLGATLIWRSESAPIDHLRKIPFWEAWTAGTSPP
jgi:hypothetical protein